MDLIKYIPWELLAGASILTVLGVAGATFWFTRSWKLAALAAITLGIPLLIKTFQKKGYDQGRASHQAEVREANKELLNESVKVEKQSQARTPSDRRKRVGRFVRDD